jgi:hypothetical protein
MELIDTLACASAACPLAGHCRRQLAHRANPRLPADELTWTSHQPGDETEIIRCVAYLPAPRETGAIA